MITVQYQVLAYQPYAFSGEWGAVAFVAYYPGGDRLDFVKAPRLDRISSLFPNVDMDALRNVYLPLIAKEFRLEAVRMAKTVELPFQAQPESLRAFTEKIIPKNDGSLQFQEVKEMRGPDFEFIMNYLREQFFELHRKPGDQRLDDAEVWRKQFRPSVKLEVDRFQADFHVERRQREWIFDYGYQKGSLHLIDPASFALVNKQSITRKLDSRYGKYSQIALGAPDEQFSIYVPAAFSESRKLEPLIRDTLEKQLPASNLEVRVFDVNQVGEFKQRLQLALAGEEGAEES